MPSPIIARTNPNPGAPPTGRTATNQESRFSNVEEATAYFTAQKLRDPNFQAPEGYRWEGDHYVRDTQSPMEDIGKYVGMGAAIGAPIVAGGMGLAGLAGAGGAGAAGAGATTTAGIGMPAATTGLGGVGTAAAAGGIMGGLKKAGGILGRLAPVLGAAAGNEAASTANTNSARAAADRARVDRANSMDRSIIERAGVDMERRKFQLDAPGKRLSTGVRGSLTQNYQPTQVGTGPALTMGSGAKVNPVTFSAPVLGQGARDLGGLVEQTMLDQQRAGDQFDPLKPVDFPEIREPEGDSMLGNVLGAGSLVSGIGGAIQSPTMDRLLSRYRSGRGGGGS